MACANFASALLPCRTKKPKSSMPASSLGAAPSLRKPAASASVPAMQEDDPAFAAELAALKAAFRQRLAEDREAFSAPLAAPRQPPPLEALQALSARAHRLAGAAGSFEEPALSQAARRFETLCEQPNDAAAAVQALARLVREVERAIEAAG